MSSWRGAARGLYEDELLDWRGGERERERREEGGGDGILHSRCKEGVPLW